MGAYPRRAWIKGKTLVLAGVLVASVSCTVADERATETPVNLPAPNTPVHTPRLSTATSTPQPPTPTPALGIGSTLVREKDGMVMVYVPAGAFLMGEADDAEGKFMRWVILDAFWIDRTEVSNAQYARCREANVCPRPYHADEALYNGADYPVVGVTWQDAVDYCGWAGGRLPGQAEWEYAARGPDGHIYPWGDTFDASKVNVRGEADGYRFAAPVDSFPAGASWVGALNMAGNVWEWTNDWLLLYTSDLQASPGGPAEVGLRAIRGGSWTGEAEAARAAGRYGALPDYVGSNRGFRCMVSPGK